VTAPTLPFRFAGARYAKRPQATRLAFDPGLLTRPLADVDGVSRTAARRLSGLGLETVGDLLAHYPRRYEDYRDRKKVADLRVGEEATVRGRLESLILERTARRGVQVVKALVRDETGAVEAVWFNQGYLAKVLAEGMSVSLRGAFKPRAGRPTFVVKSHEILAEEAETVHTEGMVPVYPASEAVSARMLRTVMHGLLPIARRVLDPIPIDLRVEAGLPRRADAIIAAHAPGSADDARRARARLVFEELLCMQVGLLLHKAEERGRAQAPALAPPHDTAQGFVAALPFALTEHQAAAIAEIDTDLAATAPMRRLLQGDVGSGKTVVAFYALLRAVECGHQGALMAPTETLAEQHATTAQALIGDLATVTLLSAGQTAGQKREALARLASGEAQIAIGTHALVQEDVRFHDLGLVVVDEQHRFGVAQRDELARRAAAAGHAPHMLYMTATPIPRTLALTWYADLDVTTIAGAPAGRKPVVTRLVAEDKRALGYDFVRKQLAKGRQVFVVCPAIDESDSISAATAIAEAERLTAGEFAAFRVAVLHGQMKVAERDRVMTEFKAGRVDVLVATSLIEVGIDVPNATVMMVEGAERFGLAQLHQLRGRVGRGTERSYCLLFSQTQTDQARARLTALLETVDGFALADRDLEIRGEGQLFGARQAGMPDLKLARLTRDRAALTRARKMATTILARDPQLSRVESGPLAAAVRDAFGGELAWLLKA
jgi:ATP-dependent DNA helicase RecG